jgi:hypothetical protein
VRRLRPSASEFDVDLPEEVRRAIAAEVERRESERLDWDRPDVLAMMRDLAKLSNDELVERAYAVKLTATTVEATALAKTLEARAERLLAAAVALGKGRRTRASD